MSMNLTGFVVALFFAGWIGIKSTHDITLVYMVSLIISTAAHVAKS